MENTKKIIYTGLDCMKFIAALLVILIHGVGYQYSFIRQNIVNTICCVAVPFFFMTSGFFFGSIVNREMEGGHRKFQKYFIRLTKMYLFWSVVSLPVSVYTYVVTFPGQPLIWLLRMVRSFFLTGSCGIYWYFLSMICASTVIYALVSTKHEKILYLLAVVGFLYGVIWEALGENTGFVPLNYVFQTTNVLFGSSRNFIMQGIPYMTVGYVLRKKRFIRTWVWGVAVFILATLCKAAEIRLFTGVGVFQAIQAVALFELARNSRLPISDKASRILREASTSTYCIHVLFILSFDIGLQKPWYLNCGLALTISLIVYAVVKQINSRWLCEMFNIMPQKKG